MTPSDTDPQAPPFGHHALLGIATAVVSLGFGVVPAALAWLLDPGATESLGSALRLGASGWFALQGVRLAGPLGVFGLTPLLLAAVPLLVAGYGARSSLRDADRAGPPAGGVLARGAARALSGWLAGYAVVVVAAAWFALGAGLAPVWWTMLGVLLVPVAAAGYAVTVVAREDPDLLGPRVAAWSVPATLRRAWRPGLQGAGLLLGAGVALVLVAVLWHLGRVTHVQSALAPGLFGGALLAIVQVAALPNLALWAVSFLAGPGYAVLSGASTTWSGTRSGLLPMIPVLAAQPEPRAFPAVTVAVALVPVLAGAYVARSALEGTARLATARTKAGVTVAAIAIAAGVLGLLDVLGGGPLGTGRLGAVGAPAGWLTLALFGEMLLGGAVVLTRDLWRLR